jgi:cytochrome P450
LAWQGDAPCDVHHAMLQLTLGIVTDVWFSTDAAGILADEEKLSQALAASQGREWLPPAERSVADRAAEDVLAQIDQHIARLIAARRDSAAPSASGA